MSFSTRAHMHVDINYENTKRTVSWERDVVCIEWNSSSATFICMQNSWNYKTNNSLRMLCGLYQENKTYELSRPIIISAIRPLN